MLEFVEETHSYFWNGDRVPSITQVLVEAGIVETEFCKQSGTDRGSAVHLACQFLDEGMLDESSLDSVVVPYFEAYKRFKEESGFVPDLIEHRFYNDHHGYAGTLDRTGVLNGRNVILEIKTSLKIDRWVGLQLVAQKASLQSIYDRYALQLKDNGRYKLHSFTDENDFNVFLSALTIVKWKWNGGLNATHS